MEKELYYVNSEEKFAYIHIYKRLNYLINNMDKSFNKIAIVCIGTDRSTGDCFGPLVGHMLSRVRIYEFDLYGTLENPVHATNLLDTLNNIDYNDTLVIGVDSCLGSPESIGYISMGIGGIKPGSGVGKDLPAVGDIHIAGIVNLAGFIPNVILQCTRLNTVYKMAEATSNAIRLALYQRNKNKTNVI